MPQIHIYIQPDMIEDQRIAATDDGSPSPGVRRHFTAEADAALHARLVAAGFTGPEFDAVADELVRYAYPILRAWIASGTIFSQARRSGVRGLPSFDGQVPAAADNDDITQDTLVLALRRFAERGRAGRGWTAGGGASLATYFLSGCVLAFGETYRSWQREQRRQHLAEVAAEVVAAAPTDFEVLDPADVVAARDAFQHSLPADARTRTAVVLAAAGYSHAEIAKILSDGTSPRAVEGMLRRYRSRRGRLKSSEGDQ